MAQGEAEVRMVAVGTEAIDVEELRRAVSDPAAGASVVFTGDVRDNDHERSVVSLTYEAHPGAQAALGAYPPAWTYSDRRSRSRGRCERSSSSTGV